ncbi:endonuclease/exonuclease/phosphatase family protein [Microlunatus antarcticus]|uniref:Endonuclease/exonuclease/phosphatase (EEP) superfamily protein YafD n=1 Tax=Microlunatus antarcticus TaxID=53388 RepID=A0A7W5JW41_9ACTN|nr:endonuclease/exonuclease/phosphatase family protein [Microlunatus antarcticus]MBB3326837.1 endonuclease/exonuclease/phosphatase (EEP) superfamily protein YafD [Microlunatus antarcticus]
MITNRVSTALGVVATLLLVASVALLVSRYVPYGVLPLADDTWAMATAFTDLAAPGAFLALVVAGVALVLRRRRAGVVLVALCGLAVLAQGLLLAPRWVAGPPPVSGTTLTVLALNSRLGQADPKGLVDAARTADVVVLTEATAPQLRALAGLGMTDRLPHRCAGRLPSGGAAGTAVLSRFPVTRAVPLSADLANQSRVCSVAVPGTASPLTVVAVHPGRPRLGGTGWLGEQEDLRAALPTSGPRVLAGDFNAVASHPTQRALVEDGWASAVDEAGAGWVPTYPAGSTRVPPLIDIDHVYVGGGVRTTSARAVTVPGTDHRGLLVTVALPGPG